VSGLRRISSREYDARLLIPTLILFSEYVASLGSTSHLQLFIPEPFGGKPRGE
jgi:hypothetical protein